jgi:hypothetical protein
MRLKTMNKLFRSMFIVFAILMIAAAIPVLAQEYDQDDWERAQCVHLVVVTDASGEYIQIFLYQDEFDDLVDSGTFPPVTIEVTEPNSVIEYDVVVTPRTLMLIATPSGFIEAYVWGDGSLGLVGGGEVNWRFADMDTDCLGAATDGRLNRFEQQMLAAIYSDGNGGYDVWAIDPATSEGRFDYNVTDAQVEAAIEAARSSGQAQLIASGQTSSLYALPNGDCQLNSTNAGGEVQSFVFAYVTE